MLRKPMILTSLITILALMVMACDPLAPDPKQVVVILTPTVTRTPPPTAIPPASATPSETPTEMPTAATQAATADPCTETKGQVINLSFLSKVSRGEVRYRAYLPPCYT